MYRLDDHPSVLVGAFMSGTFDNDPGQPADTAPQARRQTRTPPGLQSLLVALWVSLVGWVHAAPNHPAVD